MNYESAAGFRMALETRLAQCAREQGVSLMRLRKEVVFDRFLARLLAAEPDRWILKGALALDYRLGNRARSTKDIDLGRQDDEASATRHVLSAVSLDLGDFFVFEGERTTALDAMQGRAVGCEQAWRVGALRTSWSISALAMHLFSEQNF